MQATTPKRLLDAARNVLGRQGYDAATVREISTEAGVPQGLIHYYFGGKDGLLAELLKQEAVANRAEQQIAAASKPDAGSVTRFALDQRRRRVARDPAWHRMRFELFALGLRKPAMAGPLRELLAIGRGGVQAVLERSDISTGPDREALSAVILASLDGLALQKLADPEFDLDAAYSVLEKLLRKEL